MGCNSSSQERDVKEETSPIHIVKQSIQQQENTKLDINDLGSKNFVAEQQKNNATFEKTVKSPKTSNNIEFPQTTMEQINSPTDEIKDILQDEIIQNNMSPDMHNNFDYRNVRN